MDSVIATTPKAAEFVPHVKAIVPHSVDTIVFRPADNRATAWTDLGYGGRIEIVAVGRIRPEKGTDLYIDAMIDLMAHLPDITALVIGRAGGSHEAFWAEQKRKVAQAGLNVRNRSIVTAVIWP